MVSLNRHPQLSLAMIALAVAASVTPVAADPTRNGNIWGGHDHQPTQGEVHASELASGVAAPASQQRAAGDEVDRLYRELLHQVPPAASGQPVSP